VAHEALANYSFMTCWMHTGRTNGTAGTDGVTSCMHSHTHLNTLSNTHTLISNLSLSHTHTHTQHCAGHYLQSSAALECVLKYLTDTRKHTHICLSSWVSECVCVWVCEWRQ